MELLKLNVNGVEHSVRADAGAPLVTVLRDELGLTGAKYGCGEGQCGACTVLVAGEPVRSCVTPASGVGGRPIETIEGLAHNGKLDRVQHAFIAASAFQCGFCTPGMVLETVALLRKNAHPNKAEIRAGLEQHICRCGVYARIVKAVERAVEGGQNV